MFSKQQNGRAWGGLIWLRIGGKWGEGAAVNMEGSGSIKCLH